jgi:hypothetical protein
LPTISQRSPLTSISESAWFLPDMSTPSSWLSRTVPPVVPSLMSMFSAPVDQIVEPTIWFPSDVSGLPFEYVDQLLFADPT